MADQTTTPRRVLPNGRPAPDAAPDSALLDHDDLTKLYQALRTGHSVGLGADGHVHVHDEAGTPIDAPTQAFVESKLAEVKDMLRMGFAVEIHSDGTINANTPGSGIMYRADPHPELGDDDRATIRAALKDGDVVGIRPDGTLEIMQPEHPQPRPYAADVDRIMAELDHQVSSGTLGDQAKLGSGLVIYANQNGDTAFEYKNLPKSTLTPIAFPAENRDPHDPTAVDALHTQAAELQQRAVALRETYNQNFEKQASDVGQQRDAAAREQTSARQQAATARQQQADELKQADAATAGADAATAQARQLDAAGKPDEAAEQRELARSKTAEATELRQRSAGAGDAATKLDQQATDAATLVQQLDTRLGDIKQRADVSESAADALENRAKAMTEAAGHLSEANRLDGEAAKAKADGDGEAAQLIQNAADYERRLGSEAGAKVDAIPLDEDLVDETLKPGSVAPSPPIAWATAPATTDPTPPDTGASAAAGAEGTAVATADGSAPDPGTGTPVAAAATTDATDALGDPVLTGAAAAATDALDATGAAGSAGTAGAAGTDGLGMTDAQVREAQLADAQIDGGPAGGGPEPTAIAGVADDVLGTDSGTGAATAPLDDPLGATSSADASPGDAGSTDAGPADATAAVLPDTPAGVSTDAATDTAAVDTGTLDPLSGAGDDFVSVTDDPDAGGEIA